MIATLLQIANDSGLTDAAQGQASDGEICMSTAVMVLILAVVYVSLRAALGINRDNDR